MKKHTPFECVTWYKIQHPESGLEIEFRVSVVDGRSPETVTIGYSDNPHKFCYPLEKARELWSQYMVHGWKFCRTETPS